METATTDIIFSPFIFFAWQHVFKLMPPPVFVSMLAFVTFLGWLAEIAKCFKNVDADINLKINGIEIWF